MLRLHLGRVSVIGSARRDREQVEPYVRPDQPRVDIEHDPLGISGRRSLRSSRSLENVDDRTQDRPKVDDVPEINTLKRKLQRLEDDKWLTQDETTELLEATEAEWLPVVTLAVRTGLRVGELQGLRWGDVDLDGERLVVHRSWSDRLRSRRTSHRQRRGSRFTASSRATTVAP